MDKTDRELLITQIQATEKQTQAYFEDDRGKTPAELAALSATELQNWLNLRSTRLQFLIDEGIDRNKSDCATKP
ncbi:hypothetical protein KKI24_26210 [bacterium]|nr:hypothetical protein [bacterium]